MKTKNKRSVKNSSGSNLRNSIQSSPRSSRVVKAKIRSRERFQKLAMSQAKKYIVYSLLSFLAAQMIKFLLYSVLFTGDSTPTGLAFLIVVYLQTGLLMLTFVFFVLAVLKSLQRLLTEEF